MNCSVCNSNKKIVHHHLSYEPEIVVNVCHKCHIVMHNSVGLNEKQLNVINSWVKQYGDQWKDGSEKYYRSEQYKKTRKEYEQIRERNIEKKVK